MKYSFLILAFMYKFCIEIYTQQLLIFPNDAEPVKLFDRGFFTEGPAIGPDKCIYFSDLTFTEATNMEAGIIWKYDPEKDTTFIYRSPSGMANGIAFDANGNMIVCEGADFGGRKITSTDIKTGKSRIVTALYNSKPYNSPNDLVIDKQRRIYFTDPRYAGYEAIDQPVMGVYRIEINGSVTLLISDISMPNGITLSPDEKTLYVGCNFEGDEKSNPETSINKFVLDENDNIKSSEIFIKLPDGSGPDGIITDSEGNIYVAIRNEQNPKIKVFDKGGKEISAISIPEIPVI